jgi:integrase
MESDLIFIEEHLEFKVIKSVYTHDVVHLSKAYWTQAIRLLKETMYVAYGSTMMSNLIDDATNNTFDAARRFTDACNKTAEANEWQKRTAMSTLSNLKKILRKLALADEFIDKLQIRSNDGVSRSSNEYCLPSIYKKLPPEDPIKNLLIDWITKCKQQTRNKSQSSVKQIIGFAIHLCKALGYDISPGAARESFDKCNADKLAFATLKLALERLKSGFSKTLQMRFLLVIIPIFFNNKTITESDIRTVSAGDATKTKEFITTGLRVGRVSNILLKNVARFVNNNIIINSDGRTLEKGKKWFAFVICDKLRDALTEWIQERPINSEYLFPGRGAQPLCTSRISKIVKEIADDAKVTGPHVHAHSIRHSFAHILLEAGNDPSKVSKMIGHASTATTEKYYLKESAVEVSKRCNIPWLTRTEQIDPLPSFMKPTTSAKNISIQNRAKKKDKQMRLKALSKSFNTVGEPISE